MMISPKVKEAGISLRKGMTLIELLVVVAILGILVLLLFPSVQKVRESAWSLKCKNNLRQIALATFSFYEANKAFPPARIAVRPTGEDPDYLSCGGNEPSWLVRLFPYLEHEAAYRKWDLSKKYSKHMMRTRIHVVPSYLCPARRSSDNAIAEDDTVEYIKLPCGCSFPESKVLRGAVGDYAGNHGDLSPGSAGLPTDFYWGGNGTGVIISSRGICRDGRPVRWADRIRLEHIKDGSSNTILVGELHIPEGKLSIGPDNAPIFDGSRFYHSTRVGGEGVPLASGPQDDVAGLGLYAFGSWHSGYCNFAFADGNVQSIHTHVSSELLGLLCNRNDQTIIPDW